MQRGTVGTIQNPTHPMHGASVRVIDIPSVVEGEIPVYRVILLERFNDYSAGARFLLFIKDFAPRPTAVTVSYEEFKAAITKCKWDIAGFETDPPEGYEEAMQGPTEEWSKKTIALADRCHDLGMDRLETQMLNWLYDKLRTASPSPTDALLAVLNEVGETLQMVSSRVHRHYDWNADPDNMTLRTSHALEAWKQAKGR